MSQENVEVVRALFEAWNAGDMDALRELHDPGVIVRPVEDWPEAGPFVGREAVMGWFEQIREAWDTDAMEPISFTDAGDRVVVRLLWRGAGQGPESNFTTSRSKPTGVASGHSPGASAAPPDGGAAAFRSGCSSTARLLTMTLVTMRSRYAVLALLLFGVTGLTACGDDSSTSGTQGPKTGVQAAPTKGRSNSAEEYQGVFADSKAICGTSTPEKVAEIVGARSTSPRAIARALARGYKPKLRKRAYAGCLAGLR
jgi:hypothetical protein